MGIKLAILLLTVVVISLAPAKAEMVFVHPGGLVSEARLNFVRAQIANNVQPWKTELDNLRQSSLAVREPHAMRYINSKNDRQADTSRDDALSAYTQALLWSFTDEDKYAEGAVRILGAWSILQGFNSGSDQDKLQAGWLGSVFAAAAEIMRDYTGWSKVKKNGLQVMFKRAFYPQLVKASSWNGNVDLAQIDALISIAIFNEDSQMFELALKRLADRNPAYFYLVGDGAVAIGIEGDSGNVRKFWGQPTKWIDGLNQETCRDNGHHSQFGLGSALHVAEIAWSQGVDIYTANEARYVAALELLASQLLTGVVTTCKNKKASGHLFNTWEVGFNHYHNRAGIVLPNTQKLINQKIRPHSQRTNWNLAYETLTHAGVPGNP